MPQTTFVPRRNSAAEKALAFVRRQGRATSGEIAVHCGVESNAVMAILKACVDHGLLVSCLVARDGGRSVAEYRAGSGLEPAPDRPLKLDRAARLAAERAAAAAAPPVANVAPLAGMDAARGRDRAAPGRPAREDAEPTRRAGRPAGRITPPATPPGPADRGEAASAPRSPSAEPPVGAASPPRSPASPIPAPTAIGTLVSALQAAGIEAVQVKDVSAAFAAGGVRLVVEEPAEPRPAGERADPIAIPVFLRQRAAGARRAAETDAALRRADDWGFALDDAGWLVISSPDLDDDDLELPPAVTGRLARFLIRTQAHAPFAPLAPESDHA